MGGNYGARGEIQAPACAAFLFRPSSASHWLQACRKPLGTPIYRASALRGLAWSETPSMMEKSMRPNWNRDGRAPST